MGPSALLQPREFQFFKGSIPKNVTRKENSLITKFRTFVVVHSYMVLLLLYAVLY